MCLRMIFSSTFCSRYTLSRGEVNEAKMKNYYRHWLYCIEFVCSCRHRAISALVIQNIKELLWKQKSRKKWNVATFIAIHDSEQIKRAWAKNIMNAIFFKHNECWSFSLSLFQCEHFCFLACCLHFFCLGNFFVFSWRIFKNCIIEWMGFG